MSIEYYAGYHNGSKIIHDVLHYEIVKIFDISAYYKYGNLLILLSGPWRRSYGIWGRGIFIRFYLSSSVAFWAR